MRPSNTYRKGNWTRGYTISLSSPTMADNSKAVSIFKNNMNVIMSLFVLLLKVPASGLTTGEIAAISVFIVLVAVVAATLCLICLVGGFRFLRRRKKLMKQTEVNLIFFIGDVN